MKQQIYLGRLSNLKMDNLLITICARGGSKGVEGKNIKDLLGKPLIYYTIKQAMKWGKGKRVVVSTDTEDIAKLAKSFGAEVPFLRPAELATDTAAKVPVIRHALLTCQNIYHDVYDAVMDLDVTSPIRNVDDLEKAWQLFKKEKPKTLFSVVPARRNPYFNMVEESGNGRVKYAKPNTNFSRRQDAPQVYDMNASIYIYDSKYILDENNNKPVSDDSIVYIMDEISAIDIDREIDFKFIEFLAKENIITL